MTMNPKEEAEKRKALYEEHLKKVREDIMAGFDRVKAESSFMQLDARGIREFSERVKYMLISMVDPRDVEHIKFEVDQDPVKIGSGYVNFEPGNLFTLLLFRGHYVPSLMLVSRDKYLCDDEVTYGFRDGKSYFIPPTPLEHITVNFSITPTPDKPINWIYFERIKHGRGLGKAKLKTESYYHLENDAIVGIDNCRELSRFLYNLYKIKYFFFYHLFPAKYKTWKSKDLPKKAQGRAL